MESASPVSSPGAARFNLPDIAPESSWQPMISRQKSRYEHTPLSDFVIQTTDNLSLTTMDEVAGQEVGDDGTLEDQALPLERSLSPSFAKTTEKTSSTSPKKQGPNLRKLCVKAMVSALLGMESTHETFVFISYQRLKDLSTELDSLKNQLAKLNKALKKLKRGADGFASLTQEKEQLENTIKQLKKDRDKAKKDYKKDRSDFSRLVSAFQHMANTPDVTLNVKTAGIILKQEDGEDIEITNLHLTIKSLQLAEKEDKSGQYIEAAFCGSVSFSVRVPLYDGHALALSIKMKGVHLAVHSGAAKLLSLYSKAGNIFSLIVKGVRFALSDENLLPTQVNLSCDDLTVELKEGGEEAIARLLQKTLNTPDSLIDDLFVLCPFPLNIHIGQLKVDDLCSLGLEGSAKHLKASLAACPEGREVQSFPRTLSIRAEQGSITAATPVGTLNTTLNLVVPETVRDQELQPKQILPEDVCSSVSELVRKGTVTLVKPVFEVSRELKRVAGSSDEEWTLADNDKADINIGSLKLNVTGDLEAQVKVGPVEIKGGIEEGSASFSAKADWISPDITMHPVKLPLKSNVHVSGGMTGELTGIQTSLQQATGQWHLKGALGSANLDVKEKAPLGVTLIGSDRNHDFCVQLDNPSYMNVRGAAVEISSTPQSRLSKLNLESLYLRPVGIASVPQLLNSTEEFGVKLDTQCRELRLTEQSLRSGNQKLRLADLKSFGASLEDCDVIVGSVDDTGLELGATGTGKVYTADCVIQGDRLLAAVSKLSNSWTAWFILSGINLELTLEIPVLEHGINIRDLRLVRIHAVPGRRCNLGVCRASIECLLQSAQCFLGYRLTSAGQLAITFCGCPVKYVDLPKGLVCGAALKAPSFLAEQTGVVVKGSVPETWFDRCFDNATPGSLHEVLDCIEEMLHPVTVVNRVPLLARLPVDVFINKGDKKVLERLRNILGRESGHLLERALELTVSQKLATPDWLTEKVKQQAGTTEINSGIAGRYLLCAGDKESAFCLLLKDKGWCEEVCQLLVELQQEEARKFISQGFYQEGRAWGQKTVALVERYYREDKAWAHQLIEGLINDPELVCPEAVLLKCSHRLSGASGFKDIDHALRELEGLFSVLVDDLAKEREHSISSGELGDDEKQQLYDEALKRIFNLIRQRQRNIGCVFVHPKDKDQKDANLKLIRKIATKSELKENEMYKAAICSLFGLEGFARDESTALELLQSGLLKDYPPVQLLLKMLGETDTRFDKLICNQVQSQSFDERHASLLLSSTEGLRKRKSKTCKVD
ncbi:hypothetical protein M3P05_12730 [Sansalvadorimonas sp. 2012CJ34-2]|uniref:Uncharacterized protein n=1 Tax=Parendozoicomonas callyspongiae TaxID=2942213 RepID=A0ABT0PHE2_9GAMM|nr:hypothetical protein [Sansalvadorimonas sp. 2012CJ34-2]MCL6270789.1 hypothetical protein [Sansalvadorimonas sp. 2012CJ34-2]